MAFAVVFSTPAECDLQAIYDCVADEDIGTADSLLDDLLEICSSLEQHPDRENFPKELIDHGITEFRELHYKPYRIIYQIADTEVIVHAVLDGRRDMQSLLLQRLVR